MSFDWKNPVIGVAVGGVDYGLGYWDAHAKTPRTKPFQNAQDIGRAAMVVAGYGVGFFMPKYKEIGDTVGTVATALLTESVIDAIATAMSKKTGSTAVGGARARAAFGGMPVGQTTPVQFQGQRTY